MKKTVAAIAASVFAVPLMAQEINSSVIHNYNYVGAGYAYLHDVAGSTDGHGGFAEASVDIENFLIGVSGGFATTSGSPDLDLWSVGAAVGYNVRTMENRVNIIPRFGVAYAEVSGSGASGDATSILPGITLSYALNNTVSVNGGYTYAYDLDNTVHAHVFTTGVRIAIAEQVGLNLGASFDHRNGFNGGTVGVSYHFR